MSRRNSRGRDTGGDTGRGVKRLATGLLVAVSVVFVVATLLERSYSWATVIRVTAEASMVGALADWFAVTALFRHPMGIPIPHTAIIPRRKDQIGRALGGFVQSSFLTRENVTERVRSSGLSDRLGAWLSDPVNVGQVTHQITQGLAAVISSLDDDQLGPALQEMAIDRIRSLEVTPLVSLALAGATAEGRHQELVDALIPVARQALETNRPALAEAVERTSPAWLFHTLDDRLLRRTMEAAHEFLDGVARDRNHPFRTHVDKIAAQLIERLRHDPDLAARAEALKEELLTNPAVQHYLAGIWEGTKVAIVDQAGDPTSTLQIRVGTAITGFGASLRSDPALRDRIETWVVRIVGELADRFQGEITELVNATVERWDAQETSHRLELLIGRDLQFIRINGTVVGGLAGLGIYLVSRLIA